MSSTFRLQTSVAGLQLIEKSPDISVWDAGSLRCGELILALRGEMRRIPPDASLHLIAVDEGAREDIRAWCRLTGNKLLSSDHPHYLIQRKSS